MGEAEDRSNDHGGPPFDGVLPAPAAARAALPPPANPPAFRPSWGSDAPLAPGQILAAPNSARLRHLPPPRAVVDAVPLDLDALEGAAARARVRPVEAPTPPEAPLSTAALLGPVDVPNLRTPVVRTAPPAPATNGTAAAAATAAAEPARTAAAEPARIPAVAAGAAPRRPAPAPTKPADVPAPPASTGGRSRRTALLVGSVAVFACVAIATATWAQRRRGNDDGAPVALAATTTAVTAAVTSPATTAPPGTAAPATPAPATPAPATTAPPAPVPASSVPATVAPPTSAATTAPTPPTTALETPPTSAASVLGTSVLNREVLDALGRGVLPGGQPWPRATFADGKLVVTGAVPSNEAALTVMRVAGTLAVTPEALVNQLVVDPTVPSVRYLLVQLFDNPIFDRGVTTVRKDSEAIFELWGKRLREEPARTVVLVAHGDGTGTALATTRSKNALARVLAAGGVAPEQVEAQWSAGPATGPRLDFAIPMG